MRITSLRPEGAESDSMLVAIVAGLTRLNTAEVSRPRDGAEVENHIAHGLIVLGVDRASDAFEQTV